MQDFTPEALTKFIEGESVPLVTEMTKRPEHRPALIKFFESTQDKVFFFFAGSQTEDASAALLASFHKDAKAFKEKGLIFLFCEEEESANALQVFTLSQSFLPTIFLS